MKEKRSDRLSGRKECVKNCSDICMTVLPGKVVNMKRKLFCEICPLTYWISVQKNIASRNIRDFFDGQKFAVRKSDEKLPYQVFEHKSIIRRVLGNVDMQLQENKARNLQLTTPKIDGILIYPGEEFSFWKLVGRCPLLP